MLPTFLILATGDIPQIESKPPEPIIVEPGVNVTIGCNVCVRLKENNLKRGVNFICNPGGRPPLNFTWTFNDDLVLKKEMNVSTTESILFGDQVGNYTCRAENLAGSAMGTSSLECGLSLMFLGDTVTVSMVN